MKVKRWIQEEVEVVSVRVVVPDISEEFEHKGIAKDFPGINDRDELVMEINIDTGAIKDWPVGREDSIHIKPVDSGTYTLLDGDDRPVASLQQDYVPNRLIPGEYGDYIEMTIGADGVIKEWPKQPSLVAFFGDDDE